MADKSKWRVSIEHATEGVTETEYASQEDAEIAFAALLRANKVLKKPAKIKLLRPGH